MANDKLALVGVQEGYRDVLKITLEEERAQHEESKAKLERVTQACIEMKIEIQRLQEDNNILRTKAMKHDEAVVRACSASNELQKLKEETYKKLMNAAKTTERAQERAAHADKFESGMATQIAALQERLTATQLSTAKDRSALEKTIQHLTNTISQGNAAVSDLQSQLVASKATFQSEKENSVLEALQQIAPYKQLNNKLMQELATLREEHLATSEMCETLTLRIEDYSVENNRLKEAQRMLTAGYLKKREDREGTSEHLGVESVVRMLSIEEDAFTSPSDECVRDEREITSEEKRVLEFDPQVEQHSQLVRDQHQLRQVQEQHSQQLRYIIDNYQHPPDPIVVTPEPTPEQVEVLHTLRSSLADVRGLLAKRKHKRETSPSPPPPQVETSSNDTSK